MEINRIDNYAIKQLQKVKKTEDKKFDQVLEETMEPAESKKLSGESKIYIDMAKKMPDVRYPLVEEMKKAIQDGLYKVDPDRIAEKILGGQ